MSEDAQGNGHDRPRPLTKVPGREPLAKPLPRRFYKDVTTATDNSGFTVLLDGRALRTPGKQKLLLPAPSLADAIAAEWRAQGELIDPATMPMTRIVNSALDGVTGNEAAVREDIVAFAGSDLVCYRASAPQGLVALQIAQWDPVVDWARERLGASFRVAEGIIHVAQDEAALARVRSHLEPAGALRLAALHVMTTLTGSALIALAHADGAFDVGTAWLAAHVDEDWQIAQWGEDAEAKERRERRWADMQAASRLLGLIG